MAQNQRREDACRRLDHKQDVVAKKLKPFFDDVVGVGAGSISLRGPPSLSNREAVEIDGKKKLQRFRQKRKMLSGLESEWEVRSGPESGGESGRESGPAGSLAGSQAQRGVRRKSE